MEPIEIDDIQGHIFPGFGTTHSVVIALRLQNVMDGREVLATLLPEITTMADSLKEKDARREAAITGLARPDQKSVSLALAISGNALRSWGYDTSGFDLSFHEGMLKDAASLGDPVDNDSLPLEWTFAKGEDNRIDILLIGGHSDLATLEQSVDRWVEILEPHWKPILIEFGRRRDGDKEFFGFNDGISQPAMRGVTPGGEFLSRRTLAPGDPRAELFAKPGQLLIWPGSFLFGYPGQANSSIDPGPIVIPPATWMKNSSYLVFRRLLQNVKAFRSALTATEQFLTAQGESVPEGWLAARLVGRWPDGTPLVASPERADPEISDDHQRINNFLFAASFPPTPLADTGEPPATIPGVIADPLGRVCPRVAHIRKVNPRDGTSEIGSENHPGKLMFRRGMAFGPEEEEDPEAERGLIFLSYQTSIVDQFKFVQTNWANSTQRPTGDGLDPIIGQDGTTDTKRQIKLFAPSGSQRRCPFDGRFVIATGGGYFLTLGITGLKEVIGEK